MSTALLDVNVLIALLDPRHVHHDPAHAWFAGHDQPWASCPLTQNAVLRILGQPRYPSSPGPPAVVAPLLEAGQLTDAYLLALAVHHRGHLVTLDRRLSAEAVIGGREALWLIEA